MVYPEAARERDLHRYYQPWLDAQSLVNVNNQGAELALTYKGFRPQPSRDKALTAFAQLATLRLQVRRAMISLIDSHQQYILAEATKTLSLIADNRHEPGDHIWLGNTVIARRDGVDASAFESRYTATDDEEGTTYTGEALVVPDMTKDDRFKNREYVLAKPGVRFYAGVPIKTRAGHRIGVYAVSDDTPRLQGLTIDELKFMQDVAATVMEHLEMAKDRDDRNKGERMVRGLADFIEGVSVVEHPRAHSSPVLTPVQSEEANGDKFLIRSPSFRGSHSSTLKRQTENARIEDNDSPKSNRPPEVRSSSSMPSLHPTGATRSHEKDPEDDTTQVFYRAGHIIRTSTGADGVVFFGTVSSDIKGSPTTPGATNEPSDDSQTSDSGPPSSSGDGRFARRSKRSPQTVGGAMKDNAAAGEENARPDKICEVIGLSTDPRVPREEILTEKSFNFTERSMERYIKRFPYGKFFSFTDQGAGISSDEKSESEQQKMKGLTSAPELPQKKKKKESLIPTELLKVLPGIRSLIFLPLWDPTVEKWIAGAFIWTATAGRLMSPDNELPYLKAFGNSIMSEVARVNAQKADRAKTTFIASISHELRSPLHGILGSVEFLHDTATTSYQASLFTSIEICGKTLLDTIDHVLDYAKINKLGRAHKRKKHESRHKSFSGNNDNSVMGVTTEFDVSALVEEVVEAVCAGDAFKKAHAGTFHESGHSLRVPRSTSDAFVKDSVDVTPKAESGQVTILLNVYPTTGWIVRTQPGALRRIVMNLLGNALKYTGCGHVLVNLSATKSQDPTKLEAHLRIVDTGIGMSMEYQRTRLFSPFSQEDPFAVGTGLGLSIVRQIIDSLGGSIDVKSTKNVGTEVDVFLTLPLSAQQAKDPESSVMPSSITTKGMKTCLLIPDSPSEEDPNGEDSRLIASFRETCNNWFEMDVVETPKMQGVDADIFFVTEPSLVNKLFEFHASKSGTAPLVIVCRNPTEEIELKEKEKHRLSALGRQVEVVAQPCGPRKLARIIFNCLRRHEGPDKPAISRAITSPAALPDQPQKRPSAEELPAPHRALPVRSLSGSEPSSGLEIPERSLLRDAIKASTAAKITSTTSTPAPSSEKALPPVSPTDRQLRILVVDDNPINLQLLVMFMKKHAYAYTEATNGLEAFERYKETAVPSLAEDAASPGTRKSFDFVLMDISMPVMDGLASTREIRRFEQEKGLKPAKIVALTGLASAQAQEEAMGSGIDNYLPKPVKFAELRRLVERR